MLRVDDMLRGVSIDAEHNERAVLEHVCDVGATPTLRGSSMSGRRSSGSVITRAVAGMSATTDCFKWTTMLGSAAML